MAWFLYDVGLRHERVKGNGFLNILFFYKRTGKLA